MEILAAFKQHLCNILPNINGYKIAVAVSGGSDSMALVFILNKLAFELNVTFEAVIVNHNLRSESSSEALEVKNILEKNNIVTHILDWNGSKPTSNIQEKAREARYQLLADFCKKHSFQYLFTAHQKDDQAENFIIRLEHGAGIYGLSGIPQTNIIHDVVIIRPLLNFSRAELRNFLKLISISWVEDPSNSMDKYARVRARNFLNQYPNLKENIFQLTNKLKNTKDAIDYYTKKFIEENIMVENDVTHFNLDYFNQQPQEIRFRVLESILNKLSNKKIRGERINNLLNKLLKCNSFQASTLAGFIIRRKKCNIIIYPENK
jgi:tRNA(Ile)-lysidine synthase